MKSRSILVSCLTTLLIIFCLGALLTGWLLTLPGQAERAFGSPFDGIDPLQRVYLSAALLTQKENLIQPLNPLGESRPFRIPLGDSIHTITGRLEAEGFIPSAEAMRLYLVYAGLDKTIQAGDYQLSPRMSPLEIAHALQDATPSEVTFTILPGWRLEEIAAALPTSGLSITPENFLLSVKTPPKDFLSELGVQDEVSLEGFLFPDSYRVPREIPVEAFLFKLLENFSIKVDSEMRAGFKRQDLNLFQAVILASIVQRESIVEDEMPLIASVFLNRLKSGMKLDSDPTVQYALGFNPQQNTWWTNPLSAEDLQVDSPYNTYQHEGLPPGPIANPGLNALRAVAFPAETPYYYFRAACDGSGRHTFSETFEEHVNNACP